VLFYSVIKKCNFATVMENNKNQYKFSEGDILNFKVTGYKEIPGTEESFYILENPFGGKHLLRAIHYKNYGLKVGQLLTCKIDKINCSGKIYLEPENPVYKEGLIYDFELVMETEQENSVGERERVAIVKDLFNNEIPCSLPDNFYRDLDKKSLQCKVLRIKKGVLYLAVPEQTGNSRNIKIGEKYWFKIVGVKPLHNNVDYYILEDKEGNLYSLKKDMYVHYGFYAGGKIKCTITKYNTDGHLKIEPDHPCYETGKTYDFKYLYTEEDENPLGENHKVIVVEDALGIETKVRSLNSNDFKVPESGYIKCLVEGIRKGKAILSIA